jgi:exopolyphosphatase / guanosine-5'-triphosphate,3'-diphosphate pyrophosphatase
MGDFVTQAQERGGRNAGERPRNQYRGGADAAAPRPRFPARGAFAALDLGTNNCRLLIARPDGDHFMVVDAFSRIVRLGEGLAASGRLSDAAMDRAVSALSVCAEKLMRRNVMVARSVATEACRRAANGPEFVARVYRETGIKLDIITAQEEARLAVLGCYKLLEPGDGPALIFDIGGGSTEIVLVDSSKGHPQTVDWVSVPWGVVSLSEAAQHDSEDTTARAAAYAEMRRRVDDSFSAFGARMVARGGTNSPQPLRLLGTSGTVTTLASVHLKLASYDRKQIDGLLVDAPEMRAICANMASLSITDRAALPCIGRERADLVVAGCAILESILDLWPAPRVGVADRGIREGVLRQLMSAGIKQ